MRFKVKEFESLEEVQEFIDTMGSEFILKDVSIDTRTGNKKTIYTVLIKYDISYKA